LTKLDGLLRELKWKKTRIFKEAVDHEQEVEALKRANFRLQKKIGDKQDKPQTIRKYRQT